MKKSNRKAFTLAETIMTLFVVGVVISAALPVFTQKRIGTLNTSSGVEVPWGECSNMLGICTASGTKIALGGNAYSDYALTVNTNSDIFDVVESENRRIALFTTTGTKGYILQPKMTNLFLTEANGNFPYKINDDTLNNVILGANVVTSDTFSNNVFIGSGHTVKGETNNSVEIGSSNTNISGNNVLVVGSSNSGITSGSTIIGNDITSSNTYRFNAIGNNGVYFYTDSGTLSSAAAPFDNNFINIGNHIFGTPTVLAFNDDVNLYGTFTGVMNIASDERLKDIKSRYTKGLKEVKQIKPVVFNYKNDPNKNENVGVIAQDLQKVFPEAVVKMPSGYLGIDKLPLFFAMTNAMKEVNADTNAQLRRQENLEAEILELEKELQELTACKATGFAGKIDCFVNDIKRFFKSFEFFVKDEVNDEKA